jgi:hypothetical protein
LAQYHTRLLKTDIILLVGTAKSKKAVRNKAAQQAHHSLKSPVCSRISSRCQLHHCEDPEKFQAFVNAGPAAV